MTLNDVIKDVIFEEKQQQLKLFYDIDVFIQEFKEEGDDTANAEEPVGTEQEAVPADTEQAVEAQPAEESVSEEGDYLSESIYKRTVKGELVIPKEETMNIQTIQDLIDYLSDKNHKADKSSGIAKVLGKKQEKDDGKVISPIIQEVISILTGVGGDKQLGDIVDKGDKVIVELKYGKDKYDNIGFKINKNAGTDVFSVMIVKDGEILTGKFDQTLVNKQILYYRNSIA